MFFKFLNVISFISLLSLTAFGGVNRELPFYKNTKTNFKIIGKFLTQNPNVLNSQETLRLIMTQFLSSNTYEALKLFPQDSKALKNPDTLQEIEEVVIESLNTFIQIELIKQFSSDSIAQNELSNQIAEFFPSLSHELSQLGVDGFILNSISVFKKALGKKGFKSQLIKIFSLDLPSIIQFGG